MSPYAGHNARVVNALLGKLSTLQDQQWWIASQYHQQEPYPGLQRKLRAMSVLAGLTEDVDLAQSLARDLAPEGATERAIVEVAVAAVVLGPQRVKRAALVLATYPLRAAGIDFDHLERPDADVMHDALVQLGKTAVDAPEALASQLAKHLDNLGIETS